MVSELCCEKELVSEGDELAPQIILGIVYVAGPYRAEDEHKRKKNIDHADEKGIELGDKGWAPFIPHKMYKDWGGRFSDRQILDWCLEFLGNCDLLYVLKGWETSEGTKEEIERAKELEISIIYEKNDETY